MLGGFPTLCNHSVSHQPITFTDNTPFTSSIPSCCSCQSIDGPPPSGNLVYDANPPYKPGSLTSPSAPPLRTGTSHLPISHPFSCPGVFVNAIRSRCSLLSACLALLATEFYLQLKKTSTMRSRVQSRSTMKVLPSTMTSTPQRLKFCTSPTACTSWPER